MALAAPSRLTSALLLSSPPALRTAVVHRALAQSSALKRTTLLPPPSHSLRLCIRPLLSRICTTHSRRTYSTTSGSIPSPQPSPTTTASPDPPSAKPPRRLLLNTTLFVLFLTASFAMAAFPANETINGFVHPPTDAETLSLFEPPTPTAKEINTYITTHPLAQRLRADPTYTESRAHMKIPETLRPHNLTAGVLMGEGKLEVPPLAFNQKNTTPDGEVKGEEGTDKPLPKMTQIMYLGPALCGHPGLVHGGMLATMLDEGLARACFPALPNKVGVTASLKVDYRAPCPAGRYVVLKAETTKVEGRKAWVKGWIEMLGEEDGEGKVVVEAEALFIEPKNAGALPRSYTEGS